MACRYLRAFFEPHPRAPERFLIDTLSCEAPLGPVLTRPEMPDALCFDDVDIGAVDDLLGQLFSLEGMRNVEHLPDLLTHRRQLSMFLRYLARRVAFLNEAPGFYLNETRRFLGSILMERMIKEARDLCRVDVRSDFASTPHQVRRVSLEFIQVACTALGLTHTTLHRAPPPLYRSSFSWCSQRSR